MGRDQLTTAGKTSSKPRRGKASSSKATVSQMQARDCDSQLWRLVWQKGGVATKSRPNWSIFLPAVGERSQVTGGQFPLLFLHSTRAQAVVALQGAAQAQAVVALQRYCHLANLTESCHLHLHVAGGFSSRECGLLTMFTFRFVIRQLPDHSARKQII